MRAGTRLVAAALLAVAALAVRTAAQGQQAPAPPAGPRGTGTAQQGRAGPARFPEQQRPLADPAVIAKGKSLYDVNCARCHGADLRGGDLGGPNLLRSQIVMNDQAGEHIQPVVQTGRPNTSMPNMPPMPAMPLAQEDVAAIAAYVHSVTKTLSPTGVPAPGTGFGVFDRLVGNASAGQAYFMSKCASCHSASGDLKGIGTRMPDPMELQNYWVAGGAAAGRGGGRGSAAGAARPVTVTLILASGQKVEGRLVHADDFVVTLADADGSSKSFVRSGDIPKVDIHDPRADHKKLLPTYTDKDIHDVTAYLVTLK